VLFTPSIDAAVVGTIFPMAPAKVTLDNTGAISVVLAATDDADWVATNFTYKVTEVINGLNKRSYNIHVPAASSGGLMDLSAILVHRLSTCCCRVEA
jgi:hypothetical protein